MQIQLHQLAKRYNSETLFQELTHTFDAVSSTALLGKNGSGKSTLLQCIAGYVTPTKGSVLYLDNQKPIASEHMFQYIGYCAPYLELIEEMTVREFFNYHLLFKKSKLSATEIIQYIGLEKASDKFIENCSSGMKQRIKLAQALCIDTPIKLLDEPCTNLDEEGIALYHKMIKEFAQSGILIVASNDPVEYQMCEQQINLIHYKTTP